MKNLIYWLLLGVLVVGCTKEEDGATDLVPNVSVTENGFQVYDSQYHDLRTGIAFGSISGKQPPYKTIRIVNKSKEIRSITSFVITEPLFYLGTSTSGCANLGVNAECQIELRFTMNNSPKKSYSGELRFADVVIPLSITVASDNCPLGNHTEESICVSNQKTCIINGAEGITKWTGSAWGNCVVGFKRFQIDTVSQLTYDKQFDITTNEATSACGAGAYPCNLDFFPNSVVTLSVNYNSVTHVFWGWQGDAISCGTNPVCQITADTNKLIVADVKERKFDLIVNVEPSGGGLLSGYEPGKKHSYNGYAEITAQANPGFKFVRWENEVPTPNEYCHNLSAQKCVLSMNNDIHLKAVFEAFAIPTVQIIKTSPIDEECYYRVTFQNPDADSGNNFDRYMDDYQGVKYDIFSDMEVNKTGTGGCAVQSKLCVSNYCDLRLQCFGEGTGTFRVKQNIIKNVSSIGNQDVNSASCNFTDNIPPQIAFTTPSQPSYVSSALEYTWTVNDPSALLKFELFDSLDCTGNPIQTIDYLPNYLSQHFDITDASYYSAKITGRDTKMNVGYSTCANPLVKQGLKVIKDFGPYNLTYYKSLNYMSSAVRIPNENSVVIGLGAGTGDNELYKVNLLTGKLSIIKDICPGFCSSNPSGFTSFQDKLYFQAQDSAGTVGLWVTDGTTTGTTLVKSGVGIKTASNYQNYLIFNSKLYFYYGTTLWVTDGTANNTVAIKTFATSDPFVMHPISSTKFVMSGGDGTYGRELWISDGTTAGTTLLKDIFPGATSSMNSAMFYKTLPNGKFLFVAQSDLYGFELWSTDGTTAGTVIVKDIIPGTTSGAASSPTYAGYSGLVNNKVQFIASSTAGFPQNHQLWESDGTSAGTVMVWDGNPESPNGVGINSSAAFSGMAQKGNLLYFCARTSSTSNNAKLFVYDGSTVTQLKDLGIAITGNETETCKINVRGSTVYVYTSINIWKTNGTVAGTVVANNEFGAISGIPSLYTSPFYNTSKASYSNESVWMVQNLVDFSYIAIKEFETGILAQVKFPQTIPSGIAVGNKILLTEFFNGYGTELAAYDMDTRSFGMLMDIYPGAASSSISEMTYFNGKAYFVATSPDKGRELWVSDGTVAGTKVFRDTYVGSSGSTPMNLRVANNLLWFAANDGVFGQEYYYTDGTVSGTGLYFDMTGGITSPTSGYPGNGNSFPRQIVVMEGIYYLMTGASEVSGNSNKLIKTFGSTNNTATVIDCVNCQEIIAMGNRLFFSNYSAANGYELWMSDGTPVGTSLLKDIYPGSGSSGPISFTVYNGKVYFLADPDGKGRELWVSDGTAIGTKMVINLDVTLDRNITGLAVVGERLYFTARDDAAGAALARNSLWYTDGLNVIKDDSDYQEIKILNGRLFGTRNNEIKELQLIH